MIDNIILIAKRDDKEKSLLRTCFSSAYKIVGVKDGERAIELINKYGSKIKLAILEDNLPLLSGLDILSLITENDKVRIPVIIVSSSDDNQVAAFKRGAWDFICCPSEIEVVKARINNILNRSMELALNGTSLAVREKQNEIEELSESVPGGIAVFETEKNGDTKVKFFNNNVCEIAELSREEIQKINPLFICRTIPEDQEKVSKSLEKAYKTGKKISIVYRTLSKSGDIKYLRLSARVIMKYDGVRLTYVIYLDISKQYKRELALQQLNERTRQIVNNAPGGVFRCLRDSDWKKIEANDGFYRLIGYSKKKFHELFNDCVIRLLHPDDVEVVLKSIDSQLKKSNNARLQNRLMCKDTTRWVDVRVERTYDEKGDEYLDCIFVDVSKEADLRQQLLLYRSSRINGVFSVQLDKYFTLLYGNDRFYKMHEYTKESFQEKLNNQCYKDIYPDDIAHVEKLLSETLDKGRTYLEWTMRIITGKNNIRHFLVCGNIRKGKERIIMDGVVLDITEQKKNEEALRSSRETLRMTLLNSDISYWNYDFATKEIIQSDITALHQGLTNHANNIPESLVEKGIVRSDSVKPLLEMYDRLKKGAKKASGDFWFTSNNKKDYWCEHIDYTNTFDEKGKPLFAKGIGKDVTKEKRAEQHFREELEYSSATQSENLIVKTRCNLTKNILESYSAKEDASLSKSGIPYTKATENLFSRCYTKEDREKLKGYLDRERIIEAFLNSESSFSFDYRRVKNDGIVIWVNTILKIYQNPETKDIMTFMYTFDINEEKLKEGIIKNVTAVDYDYVGCINLKRNTIRLFIGDDKKSHSLPSFSDDYERVLCEINRKIVDPVDAERSIRDMKISGIRKHLKDKPVFSAVYSFNDEKGKPVQKRIQYSYLDDSHELVICTRTDVTDIFEQQRIQQENLQNALLLAEQANNAKSDFLSRMSHEIRTPMNAIIGMCTIASQANGDMDQITDCLSKIDLSSRFLLSLINDILDMSRIESGRMTLKRERIPFEEFLNGINSICYTNAKQKNIEYVNSVDSNIGNYYYGDVMKLQQIFINLLSNSMKFTPPNGKVVFDIKQLKRDESHALLRFTVRDTGCGISEKFLPYIFDPFSQEHSGTTSMYGGTGLGLAICNNLVNMMNGTIDVKSKVGVGTEFVVTLKLGTPLHEEPKSKASVDFTKLKVLVIDSDVTTCEHIAHIFTDLGSEASSFSDEDEGIEAIVSPDSFDLILVDWKAGPLDGLTISGIIRKKVSPDVKIALMTSADWISIEAEAKIAGIDCIINKPMIKSSLVEAVEEIYGKTNRHSISSMKTDFDFRGKRILLAEDQKLN
ncbi:MAG: PAS domain-containing protein, partial [Bacilli bacterium]